MDDAPQGRIPWVDYYKGIAIFSVVWLHVHSSEVLDWCINAYVIPVFLACSGFLFSYRRNPSFSGFLRKRFRQLVVPYLWINLLAYAAWFLALRHYGDNALDSLAWYKPLAAIFIGWPRWLVQDVPLWAIMAFFSVEIVYYVLRRAVRSGFAVIALSLVVCWVAYRFARGWLEWLPFCLGPALFGLPFYALGHVVAERRAMFPGAFRLNAPLALAGLALFLCGLLNNSPVAFYVCEFGNPVFFLIGGVGGVILVEQLSLLLARRFGDTPFVVFVSKSTLLVCGFHLLVFAAVKGVALFVFGIPPGLLSANVFNGLLFAVVAFGLSLVPAYIVFRYFNFLVDKR